MISEKMSKWLKLFGGFLGWFLVNTAIYAVLNIPDPKNRMLNSDNAIVIWLLVLLINLVVLTIFATLNRTRWIALGMIGALAVNFAISTLFLTATDALCFIPITYPKFDQRNPVRTPAKTVVTAGNKPIGFHDGNSGMVNSVECVVFGWATDPDDRTIYLTIRVLSDGVEVTRGSANLYRPDLTGAGGCPGGTCGFHFKLSNLITAGTSHSILVQVQDAQTGSWSTLGNSPKNLVCNR